MKCKQKNKAVQLKSEKSDFLQEKKKNLSNIFHLIFSLKESMNKIPDALDRRTLFVRAIPRGATNESLTDFFAQFAPVRHAVIVLDTEKNSRGFGFVSFTNDEDTLSALASAKKLKFMDRLLRIDIAKRRERSKDGKDSAKPVKATVPPETIALQKTSRVIIRNLPWSVKKTEQLEDLFKKFGQVKEVRIPKKKDGKMCGFAFITLSKHTSAVRAVKESQGLKIDGREVAVDFAVDKNHWDTLKQDEEEEEEEEAEEEAEVEAEEKEEVEEEAEDDEDEDEEMEEATSNTTTPTEDSNDEDVSDVDGEANSDDEETPYNAEDAKLLELEDTEPKEKRNRQERYSVFIRNLPYDVTPETLKAHFEKLGDVKYALPVVDKETGLPKGTAFVAFYKNAPYEECLLNAPEVNPNSLLLPDDVSPFYVFEGRIMQIAPAVDRESAARLTERSELQRKENLGRLPREKDKRNLYLLNEGRIGPHSKLAQFLAKSDMDVRERSYTLRAEQLTKNASLHLSMTRLAIRNIPRAMNDKSLKQLGRKAIVEFAKEVKDGDRQPLTKEEIDRSTKQKHLLWEKLGLDAEDEKKKAKKSGVVSQAKVINEVKGSGEYGRSRGYGFLEFRDHKHALMALRWLNAHETTIPEILNGLTEEQKKRAQTENLIAKKRLVVEFAIENAKVVKRRIEQITKGRNFTNKRKREEAEGEGEAKPEEAKPEIKEPEKKKKRGSQKGNKAKGSNVGKKSKSGEEGAAGESDEKKELSQNAKFMIGKKRRMRRAGK